MNPWLESLSCVACVACVAVCLAVCLAATQVWGVGLETIDIDEYARHARTGDLVFFRANTIDLVHDLVSSFTHVGLVLVEPGRAPLLAEIHKDEDIHGTWQPSGVYLNDLTWRVTQCDSRVFVVPRTTPIDAAEVRSAVTSLVDAPYPRALRRHVAACVMCPMYAPRDGRVMCSEFVMRVLGEPRWRCKTPADVMRWAQDEGSAYACGIEIVGIT